MGDPLLFHCSPAGADVLIDLDVPPSGATHEQGPSKRSPRTRGDERGAGIVGAEGDEMEEHSRRPMDGPMTGGTEPDDLERKRIVRVVSVEFRVKSATLFAHSRLDHATTLQGCL